MRFGYIAIITMLSIVSVNCYTNRPFNPQKKKLFINPKKINVKVTEPYLPSKEPKLNQIYKNNRLNKQPKQIKSTNNQNKNKDDLPLWTELLEVER